MNTSIALSFILKTNTQCSYLSLRRNLLGDEGAIELAKVIRTTRSLVYVDLASTGLLSRGGTVIFRALQKNESITSLDLSTCSGLIHNHIDSASTKELIHVLLNNKVLSILNLNGNAIKVAGIENISRGIAGNTCLLSLKIAYNEFEGGVKCINYLKRIVCDANLKELDISGNKLGNKYFEEVIILLAKSTINRINLSSVDIDCN